MRISAVFFPRPYFQLLTLHTFWISTGLYKDYCSVSYKHCKLFICNVKIASIVLDDYRINLKFKHCRSRIQFFLHNWRSFASNLFGFFDRSDHTFPPAIHKTKHTFFFFHYHYWILIFLGINVKQVQEKQKLHYLEFLFFTPLFTQYKIQKQLKVMNYWTRLLQKEEIRSVDPRLEEVMIILIMKPSSWESVPQFNITEQETYSKGNKYKYAETLLSALFIICYNDK